VKKNYGASKECSRMQFDLCYFLLLPKLGFLRYNVVFGVNVI